MLNNFTEWRSGEKFFLKNNRTDSGATAVAMDCCSIEYF